MNKKIFAMSVCAALLMSCADVQEATGVADGADGDSRIQVALGFAPMDVVSRTRATETVTAKSFAGQEPTEANPFHPMVWFTRTPGDYLSETGAAYHNKVKFTSTGLTFPDTPIEYDTTDKDAYTYCFGLHPNNEDFGRTVWDLEINTTGWEPTPQGSVLWADITGQEDLMFAPVVKGSLNDKFNSTVYDEENDADKRLKFSHLLTWLKIRVMPGEQGVGEAWGKVKLLRVKSKERVRVDLGSMTIYTRTDADDVPVYDVPAFVPDPEDPVNRQPYKDLEPEEAENPEIGNILVVPATEYEIEYQTEKMTASKTITVQMKNADGSTLASADDARNKVFVVSLVFYQREKVEAQCTLEPMTDALDQLYGKSLAPLTLECSVGAHTFNGLEQIITAAITVKDGTTPLTGTDYDISYSNNINAGTAVVTAVGKGAYAGRVGTKTFNIAKAPGGGTISYAPASDTKTFGDDPFTPTLTNNLTGPAPLSYTISYTTSNGDVATVSTDGKVTIHHAGSATITATVGDGINHTFLTAPTATYTLTVDKKAASLNYPVTAIYKTYGDESFINRLVNTGDGEIEFSSSGEAATVDAEGRVTIVKATADPIKIKAKIKSGTGTDYAYTPSEVSYELTVNKAEASISYATKNITMRRTGVAADDKFTNPLTNTGDGTVTFTSGNSAVAMVNQDTGEVTLVAPGYTTISAVVSDNDKYHYDKTSVSYSLTVSN